MKMKYHVYSPLEYIGNIYTVMLLWLLLLVCATLCGCSARVLKHELEYQGTKLVLETLNDPYGQQAVYSFLEKY